MEPIDVESLNSAPLTTLVPYGISEDEYLASERFEQKGIPPLENKS